MIKSMERVNINTLMEMYIKEIGKMEIELDWEK